jgi:hypothetical protein
MMWVKLCRTTRHDITLAIPQTASKRLHVYGLAVEAHCYAGDSPQNVVFGDTITIHNMI